MAGHSVIEATDGDQVVHLVSTTNPDVILLDVMMPVMDGWQTLAALKANAATQRTPVIIISALHTDKDFKRARDLGAVDYVTKPWSQGELTERIRWALITSEAA